MTLILKVPTRQEVESLAIGDQALNCFGRYARVVEIFGRGNDVTGKAYVCFHTEFGPNSTMSASYKEAELVRHVGTSHKYTSHQLDRIEAEMVKAGETIRDE